MCTRRHIRDCADVRSAKCRRTPEHVDRYRRPGISLPKFRRANSPNERIRRSRLVHTPTCALEHAALSNASTSHPAPTGVLARRDPCAPTACARERPALFRGVRRACRQGAFQRFQRHTKSRSREWSNKTRRAPAPCGIDRCGMGGEDIHPVRFLANAAGLCRAALAPNSHSAAVHRQQSHPIATPGCASEYVAAAADRPARHRADRGPGNTCPPIPEPNSPGYLGRA
jgi:hypothetical protein